MLKMKTIRSKLFLSYGAILLLVCIFFAVSYSVSKNIIQKSAATNSLNSVKIIGQDLNSELTYLFNLRDQIYNDSDVNFYINRLKRELDRLNQKLRKVQTKYTFKDIIGKDPAMQKVIETARVASMTPATIMLRGESGTGKEIFANAIHNNSPRCV